jgi:SAM-dependent methyltransferase
VLRALLLRHGRADAAALRLIEVGCGAGGNLLELLRLGFRPGHLQGVELLPQRLAQARELLPPSLLLHAGDACALALPEASQDVVFVSTVFSSLLDDAFQQRLAEAMWRWLKPGGAVLWYDFTVDNPANRDVRGVPLARVRALFPQGRLQHRRLTLAPPLARALARVHPALLPLFDTVPLLRTHVLAWIEKPR